MRDFLLCRSHDEKSQVEIASLQLVDERFVEQCCLLSHHTNYHHQKKVAVGEMAVCLVWSGR